MLLQKSFHLQLHTIANDILYALLYRTSEEIFGSYFKLIYQYFFFRDFAFLFERFKPLYSNTNSDFDAKKGLTSCSAKQDVEFLQMILLSNP